MKEMILAALAKMDPEDDAQWTDEGLPLLEKVQELAESEAITRGDIAENGNGFDRASARLVAADRSKQEAADRAAVLGDDAPKADAADAAAPEPPKAPDAKADEPKASPDAQGAKDKGRDRRAFLQADVDKALSALGRHDDLVSRTKVQRAGLERAHGEAVKRLEREFPPVRPADATQAWLRSQRDQRQKRSTTVLHSIGQAPIDAVMTRRTGHGNRRPTIPLVQGEHIVNRA